MKVVLIKKEATDGRILHLTIGKEYEVLGIEADNYRILNDPDTKPYGNDPCLYEPQYFQIIDSTEPSFWVCKFGSDGERYCYPPEWKEPGFFEAYHDHVKSVRNQFWQDMQQYYPETWKGRNG